MSAKTFVESLKRLMGDKNENASFYYDFILNNGVEKNRKEHGDKKTENEMKGNRFPSKECFSNAQKIAFSHPKFDYVEGIVDTGLIPVEHAWNELNGKIIDVTLVEREPEYYDYMQKKFRQSLSENSKKEYQNANYFGVKIPLSFVRHTVLEKEVFSDVLKDFVFSCIKPAKENKKIPEYCGDLSKYNF